MGATLTLRLLSHGYEVHFWQTVTYITHFAFHYSYISSAGTMSFGVIILVSHARVMRNLGKQLTIYIYIPIILLG